jgi:hypothetical protein
MVVAMMHPEAKHGGTRRGSSPATVLEQFPMVSKQSLSQARKVLRLAGDGRGDDVSGEGGLGGRGKKPNEPVQFPMVSRTSLAAARKVLRLARDGRGHDVSRS